MHEPAVDSSTEDMKKMCFVGATVVPPRATETTQRLAKTTGWLTLALAGLGMLGPLSLESLVIPGNAAATAASVTGSPWLLNLGLGAWIGIVVLDVLLSVTLYLLLTPAGRFLALVTAAFRLVYSAMIGALLVLPFLARTLLVEDSGDVSSRQSQALAALEAFDVGFLVALVIFGFHLMVLGWLLFRSGYVPRVLSCLVVAAGLGYVGDSLFQLMTASGGGWLSAVLLTAAIVGELGLAVWLVTKGVSTPTSEQDHRLRV